MVKQLLNFPNQLFRENQLYFSLFIAFLLISGVLLSILEQGDLILLFSENRSPFGDFFFKYGTKLGEEGVYFLGLFLLLGIAYRKAVVLPLLGLTVSFLSYFSKSYFGHPRPGRYYEFAGTLDQINLVEGVVLNVGDTSFPSGHTMSAFAFYTFLALCIPNKRVVPVFLFTIALIVGISRVYLVQHFLKDVYLGAIMGVLIAMGWYYIQARFLDREGTWWNRRWEKVKIRW